MTMKEFRELTEGIPDDAKIGVIAHGGVPITFDKSNVKFKTVLRNGMVSYRNVEAEEAEFVIVADEPSVCDYDGSSLSMRG